jgi:hypothetical protein
MTRMQILRAAFETDLLDVNIASAVSGVTSMMEGRGGGAAAPGGEIIWPDPRCCCCCCCCGGGALEPACCVGREANDAQGDFASAARASGRLTDAREQTRAGARMKERSIDAGYIIYLNSSREKTAREKAARCGCDCARHTLAPP